MLKHHKEKYKHWKLLKEDIALPDEQSVKDELNNILLSLPYWSC
jgi:hypothetical protein